MSRAMSLWPPLLLLQEISTKKRSTSGRIEAALESANRAKDVCTLVDFIRRWVLDAFVQEASEGRCFISGSADAVHCCQQRTYFRSQTETHPFDAVQIARGREISEPMLSAEQFAPESPRRTLRYEASPAQT